MPLPAFGCLMSVVTNRRNPIRRDQIVCFPVTVFSGWVGVCCCSSISNNHSTLSTSPTSTSYPSPSSRLYISLYKSSAPRLLHTPSIDRTSHLTPLAPCLSRKAFISPSLRLKEARVSSLPRHSSSSSSCTARLTRADANCSRIGKRYRPSSTRYVFTFRTDGWSVCLA
jgi:hypothetical protein